jgi:hypothetical protein
MCQQPQLVPAVGGRVTPSMVSARTSDARVSVLAAADALSLVRMSVEPVALRGVAPAVEGAQQRVSVMSESALRCISAPVAVTGPRRGGEMMTGLVAAGGLWGRGRTPGVVELTSASVAIAAAVDHGDRRMLRREQTA